jgi:hypothetical protein
LFWRLQKNYTIFLNRVFELSLLRNAQKHDKKEPRKTTEEEQKKPEGTKATFFVMSPDGLLTKVLCYEAPKNAMKINRFKKK